MINGWGYSCEIALRWMWVDLTDDKSTLIQVDVRQQVITWANVDTDRCEHTASISHNELTLDLQRDSLWQHHRFWMMPSGQWIWCKNIDTRTCLEINIWSLWFSTVPADGVAPLVARASAGTVMTNHRFCLYTGLTLRWLTSVRPYRWVNSRET